MSQENVEIVRRGYELLNSGQLEEAFALYHPEIEVHLAKDPDGVVGLDFRETYRGVEGILQFLSQISEAWEDPSWVPEDYRDAGDQILVYIRFTGRGKSSGIEIERPMAHVNTVRDGKVVRHETFWDRAEALEAVGLRE